MADRPLNLVECPPEISTKIDIYIHLHHEIKRQERELQRLREVIVDHGKKVRADRLAMGLPDESFKLEGHQDAITFICADTGGAISHNEFEKLSEEFPGLAHQLVELDYSAFRLEAKTLKENFSFVISAMERLPAPVLSTLIRPMPLTLKKGCTDLLKGNRDTGLIIKVLDRFKATIKLQEG